MRFKKIHEIKNIDAFDHFEWDGGDLNKFNLIYGWNGTGKTTISKLFYSLENKKALPVFSTATFQIRTDEGTLKETDIPSHAASIKVYNEDFLRDHLSFRESSAKKILIAGKENKEATQEVEALVQLQKEIQTKQKNQQDERSKIPSPDLILREAGTKVVEQFTGTPLGSGEYAGRKYDARRVSPYIADKTLSIENLDEKILSQLDIDTLRETVKSSRSSITFTPQKLENFSSLFADANSLLSTYVEVEDVEGLKEDRELRDWVELGFHLHQDRSSDVCQFCKKPLDQGYMERLGKFFTNELIDTQKKIDQATNNLAQIWHSYDDEIGSLENSNLFSDLAAEYLSTKSAAQDQARKIGGMVGQLIKSLAEKKNNLHKGAKTIPSVAYPETDIKNFNDLVERITSIAKKHNQRIEGISSAAKALELHTIASILKSKEYFPKKAAADALDKQILESGIELDNVIREIGLKRAPIVNAALAIKATNDSLKTYFGESHIYLENDPSGTGAEYVIKRRRQNATSLSQGEKSVLSLLYFLTKLEEEGFDKNNSVIVIDDPVDSQDEVFLFKTFSLIKSYLKNAGQVIILTHNFPFFNLTRDWFMNEDSKSLKAKNPAISEYFSMTSKRTPASHETRIGVMHKLLKEHKTEYHYLFFKLYQFNANVRELDEPLVPNVARKVLEYFSSFKWACDMNEQFSNVVQTRFHGEPEHIKSVGTYVEKFVQEFSHGKDFSRPITATIFEAKEIARNVLRFIEIADPDHYKRMKALCEKEDAEIIIPASAPVIAVQKAA